MKYIKFILPFLLMILLTSPLSAQAINPYELTWLVFGSSGAASGGDYQVVATVRTVDNTKSSGGDYDLDGGLVGDTPPTAQGNVYLPLIIKP